ncbi:hypothetical protein [Haloparvum sedimenti]|uniref:hypothetical protein n=1 Tax=Haloparvum sedimenti TaxID=1678448 RepID=UPI00071E7277|nr:hypothetical protein [Haloparvum sedimenti]
MQLRDALDDYKRHAGHPTRFPGERRTTTGRFSGDAGRLVHVAPHGGLRDFGYPLSGRTGIERSRLGVATVDGDVTWFDERKNDQRYVDGTALVKTTHETPFGRVEQHDCSLGETHLTHVSVEGQVPEDLQFVVYASFAPDGRDDRVGQLRFTDTVEFYHGDEHDFLASAAGFDDVRGQLPTTFPEVLDEEPVDLPRERDEDRYEEARLSGEVLARVPFEEGTATVATLLTDHTETPREAARERLDAVLDRDWSPERLAVAADDRLLDAPAEAADPDGVRADLRAITLLSAPSGLRMAGPDFDPHYRHSGGYGYTWFRDDAEISRFLIVADGLLDIGLDEWHRRSAARYVEIQRPDGSWPHRVWPRDGTLAPGWANARLEDGSDLDYQADQTGSVIAFLATAYDRGVTGDVPGVEETLALALDGLDETLADDGRPVACQNAWENMAGRFTHTTATFLEAYASLAGTDHPDADRAAARAREVYESLDDLWVSERGSYALRETVDGEVDDRLDSASLALVSAHRAFGRVETIDEERLDRLVSHVETVVEGLHRDPEESAVAGLVRFEDDDWRRREQAEPKVWTVSTAWGANACAELAALLADRSDDRAAPLADRARDLLALVASDGPLCPDTGYLPEQFFDDGTPDSATPLGWPHALRLSTRALLADRGMLTEDPAIADD